MIPKVIQEKVQEMVNGVVNQLQAEENIQEEELRTKYVDRLLGKGMSNKIGKVGLSINMNGNDGHSVFYREKQKLWQVCFKKEQEIRRKVSKIVDEYDLEQALGNEPNLKKLLEEVKEILA